MRAGRWQLVGVDIAIVASFVIESAITLDRISVPGESLRGEHDYLAPGGKGTNQAVAAARQGKQIGIVARTAIDLVYITPSGDSCLGIYIGANDRAKASTAG